MIAFKLLVACQSVNLKELDAMKGQTKLRGYSSALQAWEWGTEEVSSISWCLVDISWIIFTHDPHEK